MLLLNSISRACFLLAAVTCSLYVYTTISVPEALRGWKWTFLWPSLYVLDGLQVLVQLLLRRHPAEDAPQPRVPGLGDRVSVARSRELSARQLGQAVVVLVPPAVVRAARRIWNLERSGYQGHLFFDSFNGRPYFCLWPLAKVIWADIVVAFWIYSVQFTAFSCYPF